MAIAFPLPVSDFVAGLRFARQVYRFEVMQEQTPLGGGEVITAELAPPRWRGSFDLVPLDYAATAAVSADLDLLQNVGASFLVADMLRPGPRLDPAGVSLGAASVVVDAIEASRREVSLSGLPVGYTLSRGDCFSIAYGSGPVRYTRHRIVTATAVANGAGIIGPIEVANSIPAGVSAAAAVKLVFPECKAVIVPGSRRGGEDGIGISGAIGFDWVETKL